MRSIYIKEITAFFNSLTGYLAIGLFLLATGLLLWVFPDTSVLAHGYASLDSFFQLSPYLFMFFIPAITMRSIAGERSDGTWQLLLTRPVSMHHILLGKFLGSLTIVLLALIPTTVYYLTIYQLATPVGNVDTGAIVGSYIGLTLLGAAFSAVGVFASALNKNVIVAFLVALFGCFLLFYGFESASGLTAFSNMAYGIASLGIQSHFDAISRGVLDSRDLVYFFSVIFVFLAAAYAWLLRDRWAVKAMMTRIVMMVSGIIVINLFAAWFFGRIDLTADKRFTLSPISIKTIKELRAPLHVTVLLDGDLPAGFERLKRAAIDMLHDMKRYAPGMLSFSVVDPLTGNTQQQRENTDALAQHGVMPTNLNVRTDAGFSQQLVYPAALVTVDDTDIPVSLLQNRMNQSHEAALNNSIQNLEYALVSAIRKAAGGGRPLIGFTEGHGEPDNLKLYDAIQSLMSSYQVGFVNLDSITIGGLNRLGALIIAKPTKPFSETEKYKINHYVMGGGSVIWAIDQLDAHLDSLRSDGQQTAVARHLQLDDLLFTYGIRFNYDLIADLNSAQIPLTMGGTANQTPIELAHWPLYPVFVPNDDQPIVKNLDGIRSEFAGTLDTIAVPGIDKTILLASSPFSRVLPVPATFSLQMAAMQPDPESFGNQRYTVATLLEGEFPSVFADRPVPAGIPEGMATPRRGKPAKMIAIADGDVFSGQVNPTDGSPYPLGWDRYTEQQYGNKTFLLNAVDYLTDDGAIIDLRAKELKLRLLNGVKVQEERVLWQWINVALPCIILLLVAIGQHQMRKRKYL
ncbi:gliding motility-associated ABC transporter substrate-binding protein GldG [Parapedobacter sp. 10938]|uniref:gliding motility-associated ABC transporter substrate-binding protein GldG n=1 Tax=Parapedobacter flavus TaxID=3110225 RepID=UPI002DB9841A|nr:gliding motility-associated ABC transporter substrate-binding protein GldG [Parapedobacter sp. 10938]MEC3880200.1 gliding motility-associated ABC transporter substrate-binding protein GldG [Parapedobacter sp. 10938]